MIDSTVSSAYVEFTSADETRLVRLNERVSEKSVLVMTDSLADRDGISLSEESLMSVVTDWFAETLHSFMTNSLAVNDGISFTEEFLMIEGTDRFSEGVTPSMS